MSRRFRCSFDGLIIKRSDADRCESMRFALLCSSFQSILIAISPLGGNAQYAKMYLGTICWVDLSLDGCTTVDPDLRCSGVERLSTLISICSGMSQWAVRTNLNGQFGPSNPRINQGSLPPE